MKQMLQGVVTIALVCCMAAGALAADDERNDRVLILLADGYNSGEFWLPYRTLQAAGYTVDIAGPEKGTIEAGRKSRDQDTTANLSLDDVKPGDYVGLVIPGGYSPGNLEKHERALEICKAFDKAGKPIAAICHGPRLLMRAGVMKNRVGTCLASVKDELADAWKKGEYGKYLDQAVVVDGNLVTSRYPGDLKPFCRTMLETFAEAGGLQASQVGGGAVVVAPEMDGHHRWLYTRVLDILGVDAKLVRNDKDIAKLLADEGFAAGESVSLLVVLGGKGGQELAQGEAFGKLLNEFAGKSSTTGILVSKPMAAALKASESGEKAAKVRPFDGDGEALRAIFTEAGKHSSGRQVVAGPSPVRAIVQLDSGFSDRAWAGLVTMFGRHGVEVTEVRSKRGGWITGKAGLPVHTREMKKGQQFSMTRTADLLKIAGIPVLITYGELPEDKLEAMRKDLRAAADELGKVVDAAPVKLSDATAVIALRSGYDGQAVLGAMTALSRAGHKVALVHHNKQAVTGVNGVTLVPTATYDQKPGDDKGLLVVAPGGYYPEKRKARQADQPEWVAAQDQLDRQRIDWLLARWDRGATLLTVGYDGLMIGRNKEFKGKKFSAPDQTVWSFGRTGGRYSEDPVRITAERLISCKGPDALGQVMNLLADSDLLPQSTASRPVDKEWISDELVICVDSSGGYAIDGKELSEKEIRARMVRLAKGNSDLPIIVRLEKDAPFSAAAKVMAAIKEAGLAKEGKVKLITGG